MEQQRSFKLTIWVVSVVFFIFVFRLFQLQILQGRENRILAEQNRIQRIKIQAPRGFLLDRHGEILADNEPIFFLTQKDNEREKISRPEALQLQAEGLDANLKIDLRRHYLFGETFAHLLGYLAEVTAEELEEENLDLKGYWVGSLIGREGLEAQYEEILRGREGNELIEVNTKGEVVRRMGRILPTPGKTLTLAVDKGLQEAAVLAMKGRKGAVVAGNPQNGEILVFYSSRSFNPNLFLDKDKHEEVVKIITDEENQPLLDRAIAGLYPPGSTFKIVTSVAGLEEGKITANTLINDPGVISLGDFKFANWYFTSYGQTEGEINLARAIARSTDTFFYKVGELLGIEKLNFWAEKFNLDKNFGIDLPGELAGFVATPEWKEKATGETWFLGNTYHMAIGQGDIALTPLAVNTMTGVVANGGKICRPRVLKIGAENTPYLPECREIGIKQESLEAVKKGMVGACSEGGTGWPFFDFVPKVACKTGTAETGDGKTSHAWFTVFAPIEKPEIVLTVLVEKGGEGSSVAAPIAKKILKEYFRVR